MIIGGRSSDSVIFAPLRRCGPATTARPRGYYLGKVLELRIVLRRGLTVARKPVMGEIDDGERVSSRRCTRGSGARSPRWRGHAMYERSNPYFEYVAGGCLDMTHCSYEQFSERPTRISGPPLHPSDPDPGEARRRGQGRRSATSAIAGIRDPYTIQHVDQVIEWARTRARERFGTEGYELHYSVYGRDAIMGMRIPCAARRGMNCASSSRASPRHARWRRRCA